MGKQLIVAGVPLELSPPPKVSERWAPVNAIGKPGCEALAIAAALGLCSPELRRFVPYQHDVLAFGAAVIDFLTSEERRVIRKASDGTVLEEKKPATYAEVQTAGAEAFTLCMSNLVNVEDAQGFTRPPAETPRVGGRGSKGDSTLDS